MSEFQSLLPPNATAQESALEAATARLAEVPVPIADLWHPARCPAALLPWLAWALSVDEWHSGWDEATKRAVIAQSIAIHLTKGSVASVKRVLALVGFPAAALIEWWQVPPAGYVGVHSSEPHTFAIGFDPLANAAPFDPAHYQRLTRLLAHTAPVRSHLGLFLDVKADTELGLALVAVTTQHHRQTLYLETPPRVSQLELGMACVVQPVRVICLTSEL